MPCYDTRKDADEREAKRRLDAATQAACDMAKAIIAIDSILRKLEPETLDWIEQHEQMDQERIKKG